MRTTTCLFTSLVVICISVAWLAVSCQAYPDRHRESLQTEQSNKDFKYRIHERRHGDIIGTPDDAPQSVPKTQTTEAPLPPLELRKADKEEHLVSQKAETEPLLGSGAKSKEVSHVQHQSGPAIPTVVLNHTLAALDAATSGLSTACSLPVDDSSAINDEIQCSISGTGSAIFKGLLVEVNILLQSITEIFSNLKKEYLPGTQNGNGAVEASASELSSVLIKHVRTIMNALLSVPDCMFSLKDELAALVKVCNQWLSLQKVNPKVQEKLGTEETSSEKYLSSIDDIGRLKQITLGTVMDLLKNGPSCSTPIGPKGDFSIPTPRTDSSVGPEGDFPIPTFPADSSVGPEGDFPISTFPADSPIRPKGDFSIPTVPADSPIRPKGDVPIPTVPADSSIGPTHVFSIPTSPTDSSANSFPAGSPYPNFDSPVIPTPSSGKAEEVHSSSSGYPFKPTTTESDNKGADGIETVITTSDSVQNGDCCRHRIPKCFCNLPLVVSREKLHSALGTNQFSPDDVIIIDLNSKVLVSEPTKDHEPIIFKLLGARNLIPSCGSQECKIRTSDFTDAACIRAFQNIVCRENTKS